MVAILTSIIGEVGWPWPPTRSAAAGSRWPPVPPWALLVAVACTAAFGWHQARRWRATEASVPSLFPSQPGPAAALDQLSAEPGRADG
jgi:hypothetical protein